MGFGFAGHPRCALGVCKPVARDVDGVKRHTDCRGGEPWGEWEHSYSLSAPWPDWPTPYETEQAETMRYLSGMGAQAWQSLADDGQGGYLKSENPGTPYFRNPGTH